MPELRGHDFAQVWMASNQLSSPALPLSFSTRYWEENYRLTLICQIPPNIPQQNFGIPPSLGTVPPFGWGRSILGSEVPSDISLALDLSPHSRTVALPLEQAMPHFAVECTALSDKTGVNSHITGLVTSRFYFFCSRPGGIPARNHKGERLVVFLGIIDICLLYTSPSPRDRG